MIFARSPASARPLEDHTHVVPRHDRVRMAIHLSSESEYTKPGTVAAFRPTTP